MAKRTSDEPADAILEIAGRTEQAAEWVSENPRIVLIIGVAVLLTAAAVGGLLAVERSREESAAAALDAARTEFLEAMGGTGSSIEVPEPANPETAKNARTTAAAQLLEISEQHDGTTAALLARLERGDIRLPLEGAAAALEDWQTVAESAPADSPLRAVALERVAHAHEQSEQWTEAADAYEAAGTIAAYPLRYRALAQAVRCLEHAGEHARALGIAQRIVAEEDRLKAIAEQKGTEGAVQLLSSAGLRLPDHLDAQVRELVAAAR